MFYDFTEVYHVNVNNALELANQSVHYIGFKHKPYIINDLYVNDIFITDNWTGQELLLLLWIYILIPLSAVKMSREPSFLIIYYFPPYLQHSSSPNPNWQAFWYYAMVWFRTIDLKSHPIAQFMKNRIIHKRTHNIHKIKHKSTSVLQ